MPLLKLSFFVFQPIKTLQRSKPWLFSAMHPAELSQAGSSSFVPNIKYTSSYLGKPPTNCPIQRQAHETQRVRPPAGTLRHPPPQPPHQPRQSSQRLLPRRFPKKLGPPPPTTMWHSRL